MAIVSCLVGVGLMILVFGLGPNGQNNSSTEKKTSPAKEIPKKAKPAWNLALGNVVVIAPELGLDIKGPKDSEIESPRVAAKVEMQLLPIRELYRAESEKNPSLMGGLLLQLTVGPSGEVTQAKELGSRISGDEFRKAVLAEAAKWEFQDLVPEGATINCPLLFVREGMDITTLISWEKTLGLAEDQAALNRASNRSVQESKSTAKGSAAEKRTKQATASSPPRPKGPRYWPN